MSRRGARLTVAVLFALSAGAAAWQYHAVERTLGSRHIDTNTFERDARAIALAVAELRAAQQAYVAVGQGTEYWMGRVTTSVESLESRIDALRSRARSADATTRLDAADGSLGDFVRMDRRARDYASSGQRLLASDLIFGDGFEMTQALALDLDGARAAERTARDIEAADLEHRKRLLAGGVAGLGFLFLLILAFVQVGPRPAASRSRDDAPAPSQPDTAPTGSSLGLTFDAVESRPTPAIDLPAAAELCLDLARVADTQQIQALLERAARVLDASGIVIWIADPEGRELVPTVAHGYPAAAIARVGAIPRDADNATAAAFREGRVHTVKSDVLTSGALVAPLVTPSGCVGVMAAEVRHEREQSEDVRALAAIIAAQVATLIGITPSAGAQARVTANG